AGINMVDRTCVTAPTIKECTQDYFNRLSNQVGPSIGLHCAVQAETSDAGQKSAEAAGGCLSIAAFCDATSAARDSIRSAVMAHEALEEFANAIRCRVPFIGMAGNRGLKITPRRR